LRDKKKIKNNHEDDFEYNIDESDFSNEGDIFDSKEVLDKLPQSEIELSAMLNIVKSKFKAYKQQFLKEQQEIKSSYYFM
jgi:hypothetical protein